MLRRIIASDTVEDEGHDIMPHYLPDGRIVFSSTRQRQARAIQLDENKPQYAGQDEDDNEPAFVLHVMDADGTNIHQISFNQSHDLDPAVLPNGRIMFTRWEHEIDDNQFDLYSINPDGSDLQLLYGANSHATGTVDPATSQPSIIQFTSPRPMQDGRTLALVRPFTGTGEGGDLVLIDTQNFVDNTAPVMASAGMPGPAQTRALPTDVRTIEGPSPGGRYRSAAPLFDGTDRLLVSWSQCRLLEDTTRIVPCTSDRLANPDAVEAPPLFGIYIYDVRQNTQQPVVAPQEGFMYTEVVAGSPRVLPPVILDRAAGVDFPQDLLTEAVGILHISSVYDIDGVDQAPGGIARRARSGQRRVCDAPCPLPAHRESGRAAGRRHARHRRHRVRSEPRARHARHPRLRADRAGRLGEGQSAGQRGVQHQRARRARPPRRRRARQPPHQLAAAAAGRDAHLQRLPQRQRHPADRARARRPDELRERRRAGERQPVPEHQRRAVRRYRRNDGRSPQPHHVRRRVRAERRRGIPGLLAGDAGRRRRQSTPAIRRARRPCCPMQPIRPSMSLA